MKLCRTNNHYTTVPQLLKYSVLLVRTGPWHWSNKDIEGIETNRPHLHSFAVFIFDFKVAVFYFNDRFLSVFQTYWATFSSFSEDIDRSIWRGKKCFDFLSDLFTLTDYMKKITLSFLTHLRSMFPLQKPVSWFTLQISRLAFISGPISCGITRYLSLSCLIYLGQE